MLEKLLSTQNIEGVNVELDAPDFKDVDTIEGIIKLEHFEHLDYKKKGAAQRELLDKLRQWRKENEEDEDEEKGKTMLPDHEEN